MNDNTTTTLAYRKWILGREKHLSVTALILGFLGTSQQTGTRTGPYRHPYRLQENTGVSLETIVWPVSMTVVGRWDFSLEPSTGHSPYWFLALQRIGSGQYAKQTNSNGGTPL